MEHNPPELQVDFVKEREAAYERIYQRSPIVSSMSIGWDSFYLNPVHS